MGTGNGGTGGPDVGDASATIDDDDRCEWFEYRVRPDYSVTFMTFPDEDQAEIQRVYDHWFSAFQPANEVECSLIEMTVQSLIEIRRCRQSLAANDEHHAAVRRVLRARQRSFNEHYAFLLEWLDRPAPPGFPPALESRKPRPRRPRQAVRPKGGRAQ
jgi:hypothetical protein